LAPGLPAHEFSVVADHAVDSAGLARAKPETAARHFVREDLAATLAGWGVRRPLGDDDSTTDTKDTGW